MRKIRELEQKNAKRRFCNRGESIIVSELTKRALDKKLSIITIGQETEYTAEDLESVKRETFLNGYKTVFLIGYGTSKNEMVLACEKMI